jgi:hypothetical protein
MTVPTRWRFVSGRCSGCNAVPCRCPALVTVRCACGGTLSAADTLEDKRRAHVEHVRQPIHQAWRARDLKEASEEAGGFVARLAARDKTP